MMTCSHTPAPAAAETAEAGGALAAVLVIITLLTLLTGMLLAVFDVQYRFIRRDAHRLQARYSAEAGVYVALDSLQRNPRWRPDALPLELPAGRQALVSVVPFGGYLLIRSVARERRSRCVLRALVGEAPPAAFGNAVFAWDTESALHLAGTTRIRGDVVTGQRGVETSTFKGVPFTGELDGTVHRTPNLQPPFGDLFIFTETLTFFDGLLGGSGEGSGAQQRAAAWQLPRENPVVRFDGDGHLTRADSALLGGPVTVVAARDLTLEGPLRYEPGSVFVAGRALRLGGALTGGEGLFYAREGVELGAGMMGAGQFFSRAGLEIRAGARLAYPSVLFITGEAAELGGHIAVADSASVDGTLVHPSLDPRPALQMGRIVVGSTARVRGAIFNGQETEIHGRVDGSILTYRFFFYDSPSRYINWIRNATIDLHARPVLFLLPIGFSRSPQLRVVSWEAYIDEQDESEPV